MLDNIITKFAQKKDAGDIYNLARETFAITYDGKLDPGDMDAYINKHMSIDVVEEEIENNDALYLLIFENDEKVGYVKLTWDETPLELSGRKALKIDKFYIVKNKQRIGIGTLVMEEINEMARKSKHEVIWLKVWEKNKMALNFYKKIGFQIGGKIIFDFTGQILNDYLLMRVVQPMVEDEITVGY